jgi:putative endopeptidase
MTKPQVPIDIRNMDFSVSPRQSFFRYVNGGWMARSKIPDDKSRWSAFDELNLKVTAL